MVQPPAIDTAWRSRLSHLIETCPDGVARYHDAGRHHGHFSFAGRLLFKVYPLNLGRLIAELVTHRHIILKALYACPAAPEAAKGAAAGWTAADLDGLGPTELAQLVDACEARIAALIPDQQRSAA